MLTEKLMQLTLSGGSEWVMVVLLLLSVASLSVIVERVLFFRRRRRRLNRLGALFAGVERGNLLEHLGPALKHEPDPVLSAAIGAKPGRGDSAAEQVVAGALGCERVQLEQRLTFLGTLGNNAPFIGLFGTVLGIIRAFHDLSLDTHGGSGTVMAGISEALVATAIGLFVALPAVMAFNYFQRQVDRTLSLSEALARNVLAVTGSVATTASAGE